MLDLIEIRRYLHVNPELGLEEFETQKFLLSVIREILADKTFAKIKTWRTGILVYLEGKAAERTIGWRTDIDALPIKEMTGLPFASKNGKMHACGHDFHMTIALGLLEQLSKEQPKNNLLFLFQPAEETVSGGKMMYDEGAFGDWLPDEFYALHILDDLQVGDIATNTKTLLASACELRLTFKGKGGHAAAPHTTNDALVAAAYFVTEAQTIVSRNTDPLASAVVTFGEFHAGKTDNVIPETACLHGSIRTLTQKVNLMTQRRIKEIAEGIATSFGLSYDLSLEQFGYLPVENNPELAKDFMKFISNQEGVNLIDTPPHMFAEDFGYLLNKVAGVMFFIGVNSPAALHSAEMIPDEAAISFAVKNISQFLKLKAGS